MKSVLKISTIFILGIFGGIFADQILWPYFVERPLFYQYRLEQSPVYLTERKQIIIQENTALTSAIAKVGKTVVGVKTKETPEKILEGSGLIITSDGLMVTLADLIPQGSSFFSFFVEGKPVAFQILKRDLKNNLALVKIEEINLPTVSFADFEKIKLGERVFLVGTIFEGKTIKKIVNEGIVRSLNEDLIETNISEKNNLAGSPLFNIEGEVLGLNTINSEDMVFSVPISKIKQFLGL